MNNLKPGSTELDYLASLVGEFIEYWGFKSIHGRVWAHLFLANRPMDAAELIEKLEVSKALMSMTLTTLLDYKVIQPSPEKGRHGARTYQANPSPMEAITNVLRVREKRLLAKITAAHRLAEELPASRKSEIGIDSGRARDLGQMVLGGEALLDQLIHLNTFDTSIFGEKRE